jgi:hypothetical protein
MKFNLKVILLGGLAFYVAQFIVSMITGPFIHEGVLNEIYRANASFWRPELNQDPPDMAALMPRWITTGLIASFIMAGIYDNIRPALNGAAVVKGIKFGFIAFLFNLSATAGWSGVFNLPNEIWLWWSAEMLVVFVVGGTALGFAASKLSSD